jgi:HK97 gp10 family phage protein
MATRNTFHMSGFKELEKALKALGPEVATKTGAAAARKATNVMRDAVKDRAPFDPGPTERTWTKKDGSKSTADYGHLKDNIKTKKVKARKNHTVAFEVTTGNAFWGRFSENGTEHEPAKPWFKPALDDVAPKVVETLQAELKKGVDRAARKARK